MLNLNGEEVGSFELPADIFGQEVRRDILQRVVRWQLAKRQQVRGPPSPPGRPSTSPPVPRLVSSRKHWIAPPDYPGVS